MQTETGFNLNSNVFYSLSLCFACLVRLASRVMRTGDTYQRHAVGWGGGGKERRKKGEERERGEEALTAVRETHSHMTRCT